MLSVKRLFKRKHLILEVVISCGKKTVAPKFLYLIIERIMTLT